jgi:predicted dehydrogenase
MKLRRRPSVLRTLLVGVGNRGLWPLEKCTPEAGFVPVALCDVSAAALREARQRTGLPESVCYEHYTDALARSGPNIDCIIICAPTIFHVPYASQAVEAGIPVLIEKGMGPDWQSARALAQITADRGGQVCVVQNYRYNPVERTIRRALTDPAHPAHVGEVHLVTYSHQRVRPEPRTLNYPFACVWDMSCHHFDNLSFWFGPIATMTAQSWRASWSAYEHHNNTTAHIKFEIGVRGHYIHTHDAARASLQIEIHGERGALVYSDGAADGSGLTWSERPREQFGTRPVASVPLEEAHGEADLLRDFWEYVQRGTEPGVSVRHNLETMAACEMLVRSITERRECFRKELNS